MVTAVLALDGTSLTCAQVAAAARGQVRLGVAEPGRARAAAAAQAAILVAGRQPVYGRTTGVGANRELRWPRMTPPGTACGWCAATLAAAAR